MAGAEGGSGQDQSGKVKVFALTLTVGVDKVGKQGVCLGFAKIGDWGSNNDRFSRRRWNHCRCGVFGQLNWLLFVVGLCSSRWSHRSSNSWFWWGVQPLGDAVPDDGKSGSGGQLVNPFAGWRVGGGGGGGICCSRDTIFQTTTNLPHWGGEALKVKAFSNIKSCVLTKHTIYYTTCHKTILRSGKSTIKFHKK